MERIKPANSNPIISIIVPVFNVETCLEKCVNSLIRQTYSNIEIILVDDGSTDGSGRICDSYAKSYSFIKTIHQTNRGLSGARNTGLKHISGDFVTFVDSDDWVSERMCEILMSGYSINRSDIVIASYFLTYENGQIKNVPLIFDHVTQLDKIQTLDFLLRGFGISAWGKLFKKSVFNKCSFPEGKLDEDFASIYKFVDAANSVTYLPEEVYYYFCRQGSITKSSFSIKKIDFITNVEEAYCFFKNNFYPKKVLKWTRQFYLERCEHVIRWIEIDNNSKQFNKIKNSVRRKIILRTMTLIFSNRFHFKKKILILLSGYCPFCLKGYYKNHE